MMKAEAAAANIQSSGITFSNAEQTKGQVPLVSNPGKSAAVDLSCVHKANTEACDQACSVVTGLPCCHQVAFAIAAGKDITDYMHENDTAAGWKRQYESVEIFELPSEADYEAKNHLWDDSIRLVPPFKQKKGRPSKKRKLGVLESQKKRSASTCQVCFQRGHTQRSKSCPGGSS